MAKTIKVRWNGDRQDPDSITQYGVTFPKGEWVDVPHDHEAYKLAKEAGRFHRTAKLKGNPFFEVKGFDNDLEPSAGTGVASVTSSTPVRAPDTTYSVQGDKKKGFRVVDGKGQVATADVYDTAEDAQTVADALNAPKP